MASTMGNYQSPYGPVVNLNMESPLAPLPYSPNTNSLSVSQNIPPSQHKQSPLEPLDDDDDPNKSEAYKLIQSMLFFLTLVRSSDSHVAIISTTTKETISTAFLHHCDHLWCKSKQLLSSFAIIFMQIIQSSRSVPHGMSFVVILEH